MGVALNTFFHPLRNQKKVLDRVITRRRQKRRKTGKTKTEFTQIPKPLKLFVFIVNNPFRIKIAVFPCGALCSNGCVARSR